MLALKSGMMCRFASPLSAARPSPKGETRGFASPPRGGFAFIVDVLIILIRFTVVNLGSERYAPEECVEGEFS